MRHAGLLFAALACLAIFAAAALAAIGKGEWKGRIVDEPGSRVTFEVTSATKAVDFKAKPVAVLCGIFPNSTLETRTVVVPKMKIDGNKIAGIKVYRDRQGEYVGMAAMRGRRVKARVQGTVEYDDARCSGTEKFVAKHK